MLTEAGITKGALYYHFGSKEALGYAVIEEIISPLVDRVWLRHLQSGKKPIDALMALVQGISVRTQSGAGNVSS